MTEVRQGCILSPQLFNILRELVLTLSIQEKEIGMKIQWQCINNLRSADDFVLLTETGDNLQTLVTKGDTFSKKFGLTINKNKVEVQSSTEREDQYKHPNWWQTAKPGRELHIPLRDNIWNPHQWKWHQEKSRISHGSHPKVKIHMELQIH